MMENSGLDRRDFNKLALAAFSGMLVGGASAGVAEEKDDKKKTLLDEPHTCRGLNACKNKGGCGTTKAKNTCAGTGNCATAKAHDCKEKNACKGQGGCGATPSENACKGMGGCEVPLSDDAWKKVRKRFEAEMKKADKKFGEAPPKPKKS